MLKKILFILFVIPELFITLTFAQTINSNKLHENNASGEPILKDSVVTISGEVTVTNQFGITAYIQDFSGGVAVYDENFAKAVNIGDEVTISATVDQFNGLTELKDVTILDHFPRTPTIEPQLITCFNIRIEGNYGIENLEGELIRINNVNVNTDNWNVSGSGTNYTLTDAAGTCEIRIDQDTDIANTVAPDTSKFDVIGVLSQYDQDAPFTDGYQLMPRFNEDVIWLTGPRLITKPEEKNITPNSMTIAWETATEASSIVMYGETDDYEINTIQINETVTNHEVQLSGLMPATVYHIKAGSGDSSGTNYSSDLVVITASDPSSTGEINVYFNRSVEHALALSGNEANGGQNLAQKFIDRVNAANYSIDVCWYSWDIESVTDALIEAYNRRLRIRFIYDAHEETNYQYQVTRLKQAGINLIDDAFGNNDARKKIQHNKFAIFDARDETSITDDWVWTGSLNMTNYTNYGINAAQNVIEIQDQSLAKAYTLKFNEMWGSADNSPNAALSLFGFNKTDNTPHKFIINNKPVELYFCPSDHATSKIIDAVRSANKEIYFCIFAFTRIDLEQAMHERFTTPGGFQIRGVFDNDRDSLYNRWYPLHGSSDFAWNPPADVWIEKESGILHHKYMIIDAHHSTSDPIVITGSQNWSTSAETKNDENTLIIHDAAIANQYLQEFANRYHAAGGSSALTDVDEKNFSTTPNSFSLKQNYPNPFNNRTTIEIFVPINSYVSLTIYNLTGQQVRIFNLGYCLPGQFKINWDGSDNIGQIVAGGIYFCRLNIVKSEQAFQIRKMIYLP